MWVRVLLGVPFTMNLIDFEKVIVEAVASGLYLRACYPGRHGYNWIAEGTKVQVWTVRSIEEITESLHPVWNKIPSDNGLIFEIKDTCRYDEFTRGSKYLRIAP